MMDDLIKALTILRKYGNPIYPCHCEHDVLQVTIDYKKVSEEDLKELERLGFFPDKEYGIFKSYRFGSC
jgi:hypothetical protein